jgi:hypothetical protein
MVALVAAAAGCSSGSPASPTPAPPPVPQSAAPPPAPAPSPGPPAATITITSGGPAPKALSIAVGGRVTFVNNDTINHDIAGGPDPAHPDCHELDAVGFLTPGQRKTSDPFPAARTCDYHDHSFHSPVITGRIVITD